MLLLLLLLLVVVLIAGGIILHPRAENGVEAGGVGGEGVEVDAVGVHA
jgi:preprotein translocase subunit SecG